MGKSRRSAAKTINTTFATAAARRRAGLAAALAAALLTLGPPQVGHATSSMSVTDLNHGAAASVLAGSLGGGGVTISNVTYTGAANAAGSFSGGTEPIGFDRGIVLGSGSVQTTGTGPCSNTTDQAKGVEGPNQCDEVTTVNETPGDPDLNALSGETTFDAAVLEFDFVPQFPTVKFQYVFSSDEYNEFANTQFNDTFGFFVNGKNCAVVSVPGAGDVPVSVNTINGGNPLGTNARHPELFRSNENADGTPGTIDTEMDGLTVVLTCSANVTPGQTNHIKLAIADASDTTLDSNVFIEANSLFSGTQVTTSLAGGGQSGPKITVPSGTTVKDSAVLTGQNVSSAGGTVTYKVYSDSGCKDQFANAGTKDVSSGQVPDSNPVTFNVGGSFYWQASYSGDPNNEGGVSACGAEVVTVPTHTLTVLRSGSGSGTVTSSPPGITCGATCSNSFPEGSQITLSAAADSGSAFSGWSGGGCSGTGGCSLTLNANTTVTATFQHVNRAPAAFSSSIATDQDTPVGLTLQASDADGDSLGYTIVGGPSHGGLSGSGASLTYTPVAGYSGADSFTFKVNDGALDSNTATVSITVLHVNHAPVAQNSSAATEQGNPVSVPLQASDPDGDSLSYTIVASPSHGSLSDSGSSRTYTPTAGYSGTDSFTFKANDGQLDSNTATVSITVASRLQPPSTPVPQKTELVTVVHGKVLVQRTPGGPFVPLSGTESIPFGRAVDTSNGTARLKVAKNRKGGTSTLDVTGGMFAAAQDKTLLTTLNMKGGKFGVCGKRKLAAAGPPRKAGGTSVRHLASSGKGRFRTKGRYSTSTVKGTSWITDDRCAGTLTYVKHGTVSVFDFGLKRTVSVTTGRWYLAKPHA